MTSGAYIWQGDWLWGAKGDRTPDYTCIVVIYYHGAQSFNLIILFKKLDNAKLWIPIIMILNYGASVMELQSFI